MYTVCRIKAWRTCGGIPVNPNRDLLLWQIALELASTTVAINVYTSI